MWQFCARQHPLHANERRGPEAGVRGWGGGVKGEGRRTRMVAISWSMSTACWAAARLSTGFSPGISLHSARAVVRFCALEVGSWRLKLGFVGGVDAFWCCAGCAAVALGSGPENGRPRESSLDSCAEQLLQLYSARKIRGLPVALFHGLASHRPPSLIRKSKRRKGARAGLGIYRPAAMHTHTKTPHSITITPQLAPIKS